MAASVTRVRCRAADRPPGRGRRSAVVRAALALAAAAALAGAGPAPNGPAPGRLITVTARGSYATVTAWQRHRTGWRRVLATTAARIGANGLRDGATRRQGTSTTPAGRYRLTRAFGVAPDPGTALPYHRVTPDDWWVEDPVSPYYNRLRAARLGGFPLTEDGPHGSEHLITYPVQYRYAAVIDYNTRPAVPGRGAGIFLHALGPHAGPTTGCVAVPLPFLTTVLRWLTPGTEIRIG